MQTFQKILFPIDMSDSSTAAAPFVETMAKKFQAEVTLFHVLRDAARLRHRLVRIHGAGGYGRHPGRAPQRIRSAI